VAACLGWCRTSPPCGLQRGSAVIRRGMLLLTVAQGRCKYTSCCQTNVREVGRVRNTTQSCLQLSHTPDASLDLRARMLDFPGDGPAPLPGLRHGTPLGLAGLGLCARRRGGDGGGRGEHTGDSKRAPPGCSRCA
jgi:hypothetical protein